jgi:hypothetical protein
MAKEGAESDTKRKLPGTCRLPHPETVEPILRSWVIKTEDGSPLWTWQVDRLRDRHVNMIP